MKTTIDDVAALAGVSIKTVSRVMNNEPAVRATTREKVMKAVDELNYRPNAAARSFASKHSFTIAVLYDNPNAYYVTDIQRGLLNCLRRQNYELIIHPVSASENYDDIISSLKLGARVAGVVLTSPFSEDQALLDRLTQEGIAYVKIISSALPNDIDEHAVYVDDAAGSEQISRHLVQLGHRNIAAVMGTASHFSSIQRLEGFKRVMKQNDIEVPEASIIASEYTFDAGQEAGIQLLSRTSRPSAILAGNDELAAGVLSAARQLDLKCPDDVVIAGFENSPFSRQSWPQLTTVHQNNIYIAELAALRLLAKVSGKGDTSEPLSYTPRLIIRESTVGKV